GSQQLLAHLLTADPAGDADAIAQAVASDESLELRSHRTITGQHQLTIDAAAREQLNRLDQQLLALDAGEPAHTEQSRHGRRKAIHALVEGALETAADHLDPGPVGRVAPQTQLAAAKGADADDERGTADLLAQADRPEEFFRTVHGEAVWRAP